jgi:hypothetical protein
MPQKQGTKSWIVRAVYLFPIVLVVGSPSLRAWLHGNAGKKKALVRPREGHLARQVNRQAERKREGHAPDAAKPPPSREPASSEANARQEEEHRTDPVRTTPRSGRGREAGVPAKGSAFDPRG